MYMPLHPIIKGINILRILTHQIWDKIVLDHGLDRTATFATGIGIPRT